MKNKTISELSRHDLEINRIFDNIRQWLNYAQGMTKESILESLERMAEAKNTDKLTEY